MIQTRVEDDVVTLCERSPGLKRLAYVAVALASPYSHA